MYDRWFLAHPRSVGETYVAHLLTAAGFAVRLIAAGFACLVHAFVPCLFQTTASRTVIGLHDGMTSRHNRASEPANGRAAVIARAD